MFLASGLFAFVWGARIAVVDRFGSDLPVTDQWDAEGATLLVPFLQHRLGFLDLFAPHNEHRIACTRALALALYWLDGQWDARLECVANAALHAALAVAVLLHLRPLFTGWRAAAFFALVALLFAAPVSWNNVVAGFHTQQTFMLGFSLATVALLLTARAGTARWWCGLACGVLALFSMGAGLLGAAAAGLVLAVGAPLRETLRRHGATLASCGLIVAAGFLLQVHVAHHEMLRAQSVGDFDTAFWRVLQWPAKLFPLPAVAWFFPILAWLPWAWLTWRIVGRREECDPRERVIVAAGVWVLLQFAAAAYARGAGGPWPASRYVDTIAIGVGVNTLALLLVPARPRAATRRGAALAAAGGLGCGFACIGLAVHVAVNLAIVLPAGRATLRRYEDTVRDFVRTGDRAQLATREVPYPDADVLAARLSEPELRAVLPASVNGSGTMAPLSRAALGLSRAGLVIMAVGAGVVVVAWRSGAWHRGPYVR